MMFFLPLVYFYSFRQNSLMKKPFLAAFPVKKPLPAAFQMKKPLPASPYQGRGEEAHHFLSLP